MNNYLLESIDDVVLQQNIASIIKDNNFEDATKNYYDLEITTLDKALEDLDTYSFFTSKKVIIIKKIETLDQEENKDNINHLYNYIDTPNPSNLLIITANKLNNTLKITKELKKRLIYKNEQANTKEFIKKIFKGYTLKAGVSEMLEEYCKNDLVKLVNESRKLMDYTYKDKIITKDDVLKLGVMKLGDSKDLTFAFVRSLAEKNKKEALKKYKELLDYNIEPIAIIGLVASQFRIMYQVKVLEKDTSSNKEIASILGEKSDYRIAKTKELTRYYSEDEILKLMIELQNIDLQAKSQDVDCNFLIDMFIINM